MPTVNICNECGAEIAKESPGGFCTRCLFHLGMAAGAPDELLIAPIAADWPAVTPSSPHRFDDYELIDEIARGGMGIVWRARQLSLGRTVAVKMILAGLFASKTEVRRFHGEAEAAARLQHANIVRIHETGEWGGRPYFSMDYVEGTNLAALVRDGPLPAKRAAALIRTIADAIHYAHEHGTLHRDLKPSNILIDSYGQPWVTDFGLAKQVKADSFLTVTGQVMGSPSFMPPEQAGAKFRCGRESDVYGLGALLFFLITGRPPFLAESVSETLQLVLHSETVSPQALNPLLPPDLATICLKCLEKDPARRYSTAQAVAEELRRFLEDEPIHARPISRFGRILRWSRREPYVASLSAAVCVLMLAIVVGSPVAVFYIDRERQRAIDSEKNQRELRAGAEAARVRAEAGRTALLYWQAINAMPAPSARELEAINASTRLGPENADELAKRYDTIFRLLRQAAWLKSGCEWAIDASKGPLISIPPAVKIHQIMNAARLRGELKLARGEAEFAWHDLLAAMILARHVAANGDVPSIGVQTLVEYEFIEFVAENFHRFSPATLAQMEKEIASAPERSSARTSIHVERTLYGDWLLGEVRAALKNAGGDEAKGIAAIKEVFSQRLPMLDRDWDREFAERVIQAAGGTGEGVLKYLGEAMPFYVLMARIAVADAKDVVRQGESALRQVEANSNLLVAALIPNVYRVRKRELEVMARFAMLRSAIAHGTQGLADHTALDPEGSAFKITRVERGFEFRSKIADYGLNGRILFVTSNEPARAALR